MAIIYYEDLKSRKIIKDNFKENCKKLKPGLYYVNEDKCNSNQELIKFCEEKHLAIYFKGNSNWNNFMKEEPSYSISSNLISDILIANNSSY